MGMQLDRCPMRPFYEDRGSFNTILERWRWMRDGYLPDPGTIVDQSAKLLLFFRVVDRAVADIERDNQQKRERESNAAARKARMTGSRSRGGRSRGRR
jgi:hypothetical protein